MKPLLIYLLQLTVASGILYGYYHFFLRNKKFHQYNRYYLLIATVISVTIPFLQIPVYFTETEAESSAVIKTLKTIYYSGGEENVIVTANTKASFDWNMLLYCLYVTIAAILLIRIFVSLIKIICIIKANVIEELDGIRFINTNEPTAPFSFFRWLFWNNKIELGSEKGQQIFRHEVFHIQQKHSWDVILMEFVCMIFWINPFFHLMKKELRAIHEFLADQFAVKEEEKWNYAELLLMQALNTQQDLVNPFFHNQIKRRIAMITNSQKTSYRYLRKLLVLPLTVLVVMLVAFSYKNKMTASENALQEPITIVIDAGHGNPDPGVQSPDKKYSENLITLEIARIIKSISGEYNVNVILTREDENLPRNAINIDEGIKKRVEIAKEVNADIFLSLHISSAGNGSQNNRSGFEAYMPVRNEDSKSEKLASSLLQSISGLYTTDMTIKKRDQHSIYVLDKNTCPSVLLECGYINNPKDLAFITNRSNQEKLARKILEAIVNYKRSGEDLSLAQTISDQELKASINIEPLDPIATDQATAINVNGKKFEVKEVKIEGMEDSRVKSVELRGFYMLPDTTSPLIVIDGVKQINKSFKNLEIDPNSIEAIYVFKDKKATEKYGEAGKYGVIEIITKNNPSKETKKLDEVTVVGYAKQKVIFDKVEIEPAFPGGVTAWRKYLERNLNPNVPVDSGAPGGNYAVVVQFIVKTDGSIEDIKALTKHGYGMEEEAVRVIKHGPAWLPAIQNGKKVTAYRKQPITFVITEEDNSPTEGSSLNEVVVVGYGKEAKKEADPALAKVEIDKLSPVYPNPANNTITIPFSTQTEGKGEIRITDATGNIKIVKPTTLIKGQNNLSVNVAVLAKGIYIINVIDANKTITRTYKMIKE